MSTDVVVLAVDRFEGGVAVLVADDGSTIEVDRSVLPSGTRAGSVLRVPRAADGVLQWGGATVDRREEAERLSEAEGILEELRGRDPGGDVVL